MHLFNKRGAAQYTFNIESHSLASRETSAEKKADERASERVFAAFGDVVVSGCRMPFALDAVSPVQVQAGQWSGLTERGITVARSRI